MMPDGVEGSESRSARDLQLNHGQPGRSTSLEKGAKTLKHRRAHCPLLVSGFQSTEEFKMRAKHPGKLGGSQWRPSQLSARRKHALLGSCPRSCVSVLSEPGPRSPER